MRELPCFGQARLVAQIAARAVLARLLTPSDFGVVTMVTTFSLLLMNFGLNGFTEAVLQRAEINRDLASNLFWINVGGGLLLTVGFAGAGSLLGALLPRSSGSSGNDWNSPNYLYY